MAEKQGTFSLLNYYYYTWEDASKNDNYSYVIKRMSQTKETILKRQKIIGKQRIKQQFANSGVFSKESLAALDTLIFGFDLQDILDIQNFSNKMSQINIPTDFSTENLLGGVIDLRSVAQDTDEYLTKLNNLVSDLKKNKGLMDEITGYVLTNFQDAKKYGINSKVLQQVINSVLTKTKNGQGIIPPTNNPYSSFSNINSAAQSFLIKLWALGNNKIDASSRERIIASIKRNSVGVWNNIQGALGEASSRIIRQDVLNMTEEMYEELDEVLLQTQLTGTHQVSHTIKVDREYETMLKTAIDRGVARSNSINFQGNHVVTFVEIQQKSDKSIVTRLGVTLGGVSVKTGQTRITNGTLKLVEGIKLQDSTPLMTLLGRELGLKGKTIRRLVQIAGATGYDSYLDNIWEGLERQVTYGMLVNSLIGYGNQVKNVVMQINNNLIPMSVFLDFVVDGLTTKNTNDISGIHASGFPARDKFVELNVSHYKGIKNRPNRYLGKVRSGEVYPKELALLYQSKIVIKLRQLDLTALSSFYV